MPTDTTTTDTPGQLWLWPELQPQQPAASEPPATLLPVNASTE